MKPFNIIVAATRQGGIGISGSLPWPKLKYDMQHFANITGSKKKSPEKLNAVIMGRKTWDSLDDKYKPLPNRLNYVVTRNLGHLQGINNIYPHNSLTNALLHASNTTTEQYVIGGGEIYAQALKLPQCQTIYKTEILNNIPADTYIPEIDPKIFKLETVGKVINDNGIDYQFLKYIRKNQYQPTINNYQQFLINSGFDNRIMNSRNPEEMSYLATIKYIMDHGNVKTDRTGVGTKSIFGHSQRYNLENNTWPILTTKKVFLKGIIEELLWIISGSTDGRVLLSKNVKIWQGNGTREFLDRNNLQHYKENELGPIYGHQWRFSGAKYTGYDGYYTGQGVDQLADVINQIKSNPDSRRHIICAWNPLQIKEMALPPCHVLVQFYVANGELSCMMYQRSVDTALGEPFNIASYTLLTHMIAHITGLKAKEFIHIKGDTHIYNTHAEGLNEQIKREPYEFPKISFNRKISDINQFTRDDIKMVGYNSHPAINMPMAI